MVTVAAFYHFTRLAEPDGLRPGLRALGEAEGLRGSILVAREGINGTIAGPAAGVAAMLEAIRALPGCAGLEWKESHAADMPFRRWKVRLKREIVTMGQPDVDPQAGVGRYVEARDWNALIAAPDVAVIDTRNAYEVALGSFAGAEDPGTEAFGEFPAWWQANAARFEGKRIAMFCTGGIRCEKSTNYLIQQGVAEVFHLRGGILKYLEEVPAEDSAWHGECYVFDARVSVGHGLVPGEFSLCHACGGPVSPRDRAAPDYREGVQCPACKDRFTEADRLRFEMRQRQIEAARDR